MPEKDDSSKNARPQGIVVEIPKDSLPEKITYDVKTLSRFLNFVFDADNLEPDENILVWKTSSVAPGYPEKSCGKLLADLERATRPHKLYFGTSTTVRNPDDGKLYNRKSLFKQFYVLVLDDIGTKVPISKIPPDFKPSYIIETSAGNYQYGYVLDEPLTVREEAEALVQLVYDAGYSDAGGKMATKLVRLPDGVNGKRGGPGDADFRVRLVEMNEDQIWSPAEILDALDLGVAWADVVADAEEVMKRRAHKGMGASAWSPIKAELPALSGIIDPVAEWLYKSDQVKQETGEWLTIKCPWADLHTDGGDWASYSPLGWGDPQYQHTRNFHCFHEHCRSHKSKEFLEYVHSASDIDVPTHESAYELTSRYVYDPVNGGIHDIKRDGQPLFIKLDQFSYKHPHKVSVPSGKTKISETTLFKLARNRVDVEGVTYDPTTPAKLVTNAVGVNYVNLYTQPTWGDGDYVKADVEKFNQFIKYLVPDDEDREYLLDWLAAKAQSMAFRGPAILMIAESQGTGRSTLANMLAQLYGAENVERVPFERLSAGGGTFNDWIVKPLIITDETLALGDEGNYYKVYERLKELIDTTPQEVRVNPKFGRQRFQTTYASFMLFSNHANAMKIAENDRRVYVIKNADTPESPEYFMRLNEWISKGVWQKAVWRWLRQRKVDVSKLVSPAQITQAKRDMIQASKQPIDIAVEAVLESWPSSLVAAFQVKAILHSSRFSSRFQLKDPHTADRQIQHAINNLTKAVRKGKKVRMGDRSVRVRFIASRPGNPVFDLEAIAFDLSEFQRESINQAVEDALSEHDF